MSAKFAKKVRCELVVTTSSHRISPLLQTVFLCTYTRSKYAARESSDSNRHRQQLRKLRRGHPLSLSVTRVQRVSSVNRKFSPVTPFLISAFPRAFRFQHPRGSAGVVPYVVQVCQWVKVGFLRENPIPYNPRVTLTLF